MNNLDSVDFLIDPVEAEINTIYAQLPDIDVMDAVAANNRCGAVLVDIRENYLAHLSDEVRKKTVMRVMPILQKMSVIKLRTDQNALNLGDGVQIIFDRDLPYVQ